MAYLSLKRTAAKDHRAERGTITIDYCVMPCVDFMRVHIDPTYSPTPYTPQLLRHILRPTARFGVCDYKGACGQGSAGVPELPAYVRGRSLRR